MIVIGNEILSGRTHDKNTHHLAGELTAMGIELREGRVVPDIKQEIADAVNYARERYDYVFTSGGIGPTHDDITAESIAYAFGVECEINDEARKVLEEYYGDKLNDARLLMARVPKGGSLVENPATGAPAFKVENVYVFAGVPRIFAAMLDAAKAELVGGEPIKAANIFTNKYESEIAADLGDIQNKYPQVDIGSYPQMKSGEYGVSIVLRGDDEELISSAMTEIKGFLK